MIRVFYADDSKVTVQAMVRAPIWKENDIEIAGMAYNGEQALALLSDDIDVLVTDIRMPVMDGLELTQYVKQEYPSMPVIFISAYTEFEYARQALKLKVFDYISKPVDYPALLEKIVAAYNMECGNRRKDDLLNLYQRLGRMMRELSLDAPEQKELVKDAVSLFEHLQQLNNEDAQTAIDSFASRLHR